MDGLDRYVAAKVRFIRNRSASLRRMLPAYRSRSQVSIALKHVADAISVSLDALESALEGIETLSSQQGYDALETPLKAHDQYHVIPFLHAILNLVERSDLQEVPAELTSSIRRIVQKIFPQAELLIVSPTELNYTVIDLSKEMRKRLTLPSGFPIQLYRVAIPYVEKEQALLHAVIGHEIGHLLYETRGIGNKVPLNLPVERVYQIVLQNCVSRFSGKWTMTGFC